MWSRNGPLAKLVSLRLENLDRSKWPVLRQNFLWMLLQQMFVDIVENLDLLLKNALLVWILEIVGSLKAQKEPQNQK